MLNVHSPRRLRRGALAAVILATAAAGSACSDSDSVTGLSSSTKTYNQVQRLGNPLVSEVLLMKRDHPLHGSIGPDADVANLAPKVKAFVAAFRPSATALQDAIAGTLLPDMLIVNSNQPVTTAGYLSYVLSPTKTGYGGRKLADDVVDISLSAVFSDLLDPTQAACKPFALPLCTDNVPSHGGFTTTFPYLGTPK